MKTKESILKKLLNKILGKDKVKMLASNLDAEVSDLVMLLNDNYMMPFASCDGNLKHHLDKWGNYDMSTTYGYVAMLESDKVRDLFAILQDNDSYEITITATEDMELYGNRLYGLRYGIYFDNQWGRKAGELMQIVTSYLSGELTPTKEQRKRIDEITENMKKALGKNILLDYAIHEIFQLENDTQKPDVYSLRMFEHEPRKDFTGIRLGEMGAEDQKLEIDSEGIYYRTENVAKSLSALKKLVSEYDTLPERDGNIQGVGTVYQRDGFVDELDTHIQKHVQGMYEYRDELKQIPIDKSIARHERKVAKKKRANDEFDR